MTSQAPRRSGPGPYLWLAGLVIIAAGRALGNGFAFDDVPMIAENAQVQSLAPPWIYAQQSYWPPKNLGDAYRPWTVWWFAIQWAIGGGAPWVFHLGNLVLALAVTALVYRLLLEWLPPIGAVAGAALFAIHPVHVEANANVVGQGELWMVAFVTVGVLWYLRARRRAVWSGADRLIIALCLVLAAASKEQGIVLPALLVAIEWWLPHPHGEPDSRGETGRRRLRRLAPLYLLLAVVGVGFLAGRHAVLGDMGGGPPAAGLEGLSFGERARVMLPLVVDWVRLLVWPRTLVAQYSPPAFGLSSGFGAAGYGAADLVGGVILVAVVVILTQRRYPRLALGIAWIGIGLLPICNVIVPTGVLIAERTLYLPSIGIALMAGAVVAWAAADRRRLMATIAITVAVVAAGAARSWSRQAVWRDSPTLFAQTIVDAPRSYRSYLVRAKELVRRDAPAEATRMYREAAALYQGDPRVFEEWGQLERAAGRCEVAIPILSRGIGPHPRSTVLRSRLFECLLTIGDTTAAVEVAEAGIRLGMTEFTSSLARAAKDPAGHPAPPPATPETDR